MRRGLTELLCLLWRSPGRLRAVLLSLLLLAWLPATADWEYDDYTDITDVSITNPAASEVWLAGSDHTLTCDSSTDMDRCRPDAQSEWQNAPDSVTHYWEGGGTFQDNDNIGTSDVTYICPNSAGNDTITVYANDDYEDEELEYDDDYVADDRDEGDDEIIKSDSETVSVVIPVVDSIYYIGDKNQVIYDVTYPEYNRSPARNEPSAYIKGQHSDATVTVRFWASTPLTESSSVDVVGWIDTGDLGEWGYPEGTFGTSWPSDPFYADITQVNGTTVGKTTYTETWKYKCPSGSNTRITASTLSGRVMYFIYDDFQCNASLFTKTNIDEAVAKASGKGTEAEIASEANDKVAQGVYEGCICEDGFQTNFDAAMGRYPATGNRGMCCCRAEGLNCVLQVLGLGPYTHVYVNEIGEPNSEQYIYVDYCDTCGKTCYRKYWDGFWNNWEGAVRSGGAGTQCYAPANGSITIDEGTYAEIDAKIAVDCGYAWEYGAGHGDTCPHLAAP